MPDEAETLLAKVIEVEPANTQANKLLGQATKEKKERRRRLELIERMQGHAACGRNRNTPAAYRRL